MKLFSFSFFLFFTCISLSLQANHDPEKATSALVHSHAGYAQLVVYRPWRYVSMLAPLHLRIDKQIKLSLPNNAKDTLYLAPGSYTLKRKIGDGWPETIRVEAGETYFVRLKATMLGSQMEIVEPPLAVQELALGRFKRKGRLKVKSVSRVRLDL